MAYVWNIKRRNLLVTGYDDLKQWLEISPLHVYIGRDMTHYVPAAVGSKWYNPFSVKKYGIEECLERYREYILHTHSLRTALPELAGKVLGCWCYPNPCHGDVLIELLNETRDLENETDPSKIFHSAMSFPPGIIPSMKEYPCLG